MQTSIAILLSLVTLIIVCVLVYLMIKSKRILKMCIFAGTICILFCSILGIYHLFFYYNEEQVEIHTSTEEDSIFVLPVKNHKEKYEYTYISFSTEIDLQEMVDEIRKNNLVDNVDFYSEEKEVKLTRNNQVITIKMKNSSNFLWKKNYDYIMEAEFVNLTFSKDRVSIPFPTEYLEIEGAYENVMNVSCDMQMLKRFYEYFTNVSMDEDSIILKLNNEKTIKITLQERKVKFEEDFAI